MTDVALPLEDDAAPPVAPPPPGDNFPELVWAHYRWEQEVHSGREPHPEVTRAYQGARKAFEEEHGQILDAYWSTTCASGVAVTVKQPPAFVRWFAEPHVQFHRESDWVTKRAPAIADVLHRCDTLAISVGEVLRGTSERIAMQWIFSVASHLLGFLDRTDGAPGRDRAREVANEKQAELCKIEEYYRRAGNNAGRLVYFSGMLFGGVALVLLAPVIWVMLNIIGADDMTAKTFFACYTSGAVGAIVSVMSRMSGDRFTVDYEVGRNALRWLGSFRPVIGAVFGVALYFVVKSGILMTSPPDDTAPFFYFGTLAFLAGFSERWTRVILGKAEGTLVPQPDATASTAGSSAPS